MTTKSGRSCYAPGYVADLEWRTEERTVADQGADLAKWRADTGGPKSGIRLADKGWRTNGGVPRVEDQGRT